MKSLKEKLSVALNESRNFKQYINDLPLSAWEQPSACELWTVRDVIAHLANVNQGFANTINRGLQGVSTPPEGREPAGATNASSNADRFYQSVLSARETPISNVLDAFNQTNDQLDDLFSSLNGSDWDRPCYHPVSIFPVTMFLNTRVSELVMHGWDIRSSLDSDSRIAPDTIPLIMELLPSFFHWQFWPDARLEEPVRYRFELEGSGSRNIDILVEGDKAHYDVRDDEPPNVAFRCSTEVFVLLMYGRLNVKECMNQGQLSLEGSSDSALEFDKWFRGT